MAAYLNDYTNHLNRCFFLFVLCIEAPQQIYGNFYFILKRNDILVLLETFTL